MKPISHPIGTRYVVYFDKTMNLTKQWISLSNTMSSDLGLHNYSLPKGRTPGIYRLEMTLILTFTISGQYHIFECFTLSL